MKKILVMALSVILIATLAISGTVAYLTDDESEVNVMTVGKVNVKLWEQQREGDGTKDKKMSGDLENFEDDKNMMPITNDGKGNDTKWGMSTESNYIDKIVRVENIGESDAWVRVFFAVPAELDDRDILHWDDGRNFKNGDNEKLTSITDFMYEKLPNTVDLLDPEDKHTETYNVYCYTMHTNPLVADDNGNDMTWPVLVGAYLDPAVDYDDFTDTFYKGPKSDPANAFEYDLNKDIRIPVYVQAVQAAGFDTYNKAFAAAGLNEADGTTPKSPWVNDTMSETDEKAVVENAADFAEALKNVQPGGTITLAAGDFGTLTIDGLLEDVTIDADADSIVKFNIASTAVLDNVTITGMDVEGSSDYISIVAGATGSLNIIDCNFTGTGAGQLIKHHASGVDTTISGCSFKDSKYSIYGYAGMGALNISGCSFDNMTSWAILNNAPMYGDFTINGNNFNKCTGLAKSGVASPSDSGYHAGTTFSFSNNTITNSVMKDNKYWFEIKHENQIITGNTNDSADWTY